MRTSREHVVVLMFLMTIFAVVVAVATDRGDEVHFDIESPTEIPTELVYDAIQSGGIQAFLFGTFDEKHRFAKGEKTAFGQMTLNADDFLKYRAGWDEQKIHRLGFQTGFSNLWDR